MAQRISRAKQSIKKSGVPFSHARPTSERAARLSAVLHVLYLIFNEGYASSAGATLTRADLSSEAIRLTRAVHHLLPEDAEVAGLLALMLLTDARRAARTGRAGRADPARRAGPRAVGPRRDRGGRGADHRGARRGARSARTSCRRRSPPCTTRRRGPRTPTGRRSWRSTGCSSGMSDNPMVTLNHAIAAAMVHGPAAGLDAARRARRRRAPRRPLSAGRGARPPAAKWPATSRPRAGTTAPRPARRRAFRSGTT